MIKRARKSIRKEKKQVLKTVFVILLVTAWLLSSWPGLPFTKFPPKPQETKAAFSAVTARGSAQLNSNNSSSISVSPGANITVNKIAIVSAVSDNDDTANGATTFHSIADTDGNTWTKVYEETDSDGAADDGSTTSLWWTKVVTQIDTGDSITVTFNGLLSDATLAVFEVTVGAGNTVATVVGTPGHADLGTSLDGSLSSSSRDYLLVGNFGAEGEDATKTKDADYTLLYSLISADLGQPATNVQSHLQYRLATLTSDTVSVSTVDFTNGTQTLVGFYEVALPATLTQNDFEFWVDNDALTPAVIWGTPDIPENTALNSVPPGNDPIDPNDEIRIRMNISVTVNALSAGEEGFILQFVEASDCTTASGWADVPAANTGSTWEFADSSVTDNTALDGASLLVSTSEEEGRYNKSDPTTTNPVAVPAGQELEWDWHLEYVGSAVARTYCFRMIRDDSTTLNAYNSDSYPRIDIRPGTADLMRHGNFFTTGVERGFFWAD